MKHCWSLPLTIWAIIMAIASCLFDTGCLMAEGVRHARASGMGGATVSLTGFWSALGNQAGLAGERDLSIGVSATNQFLLRETSRAAVALAVPVGDYVLAARYRQAGHALYRDLTAGVALARSFGDRVGAGLQLEYRSVSLTGPYGRSAAISFEAGLRVRITEVLFLAVHTSNPLALPHIRSEGEGPEGHWSVGFLYRFGNQVVVNLEVVKEYLFKPVVRGGLEYELDPLVIIRAGFSSLPVAAGGAEISPVSVISFGYGLAAKRFRIDLGAGLHNVAGIVPAVSVQYVLREHE